jgi:monofunctional biosynthetic peptidoglycan transglycosylase
MARRKQASKKGREPAAPPGKREARREVQRRGFRPIGMMADGLHAVGRWLRRVALLGFGLGMMWISAYAVFAPPTTPYIVMETMRLGDVDRQWVPLEEISPHLLRAVVAAEDANFCAHWGFDMAAIRAAIADGGARGGSTISQQLVKNAYLWQGRSWLRKALEALMTPAVEAVWSKRRILEVYLNIIEFDEGVFGVEAAARHYFDKGPENLSAMQAALLAGVLPNPKRRNAGAPGPTLRRRAAGIVDGAATIAADGRAACFED